MSKALVPWSIKAVRKLAETKSVEITPPYGDSNNSEHSLIHTGSIDQSRSKVQRDQIGTQNNTTINNNYAKSREPTNIEVLLDRLQAEMENNDHASEIIGRLQRFHKVKAHGGVVGLEAKLEAAGRSYEYEDAIEQKEMFAKLLEDYSLYASAQEIMVYLLARAEYHFRQFVYPQLPALSIVEVNQIVDVNIVVPTVQECGTSVFAIDHSVAMGMIYWLAEQCHVRWHQ